MYFLLLFLLITANAAADELKITDAGGYGDVYPVKELDPADEIKRAAEKKIQELEKKRSSINPFQFALNAPHKLPPCESNSTLFLDPSYTLTEDVLLYDSKGNPWHYPAGTEINPLEHVPFGTYAVIDPSDKRQIEWLSGKDAGTRGRGDAGKSKMKVLIVSLEANDTSFAEKMPVLVYSDDLHELLSLSCAPALMTGKDGKIQVKFFRMGKEAENGK